MEGLLKALDHIDEVVSLIRSSATPPEAKERLMQRFELSEVQAQAILDMRLQRLTGLERGDLGEQLVIGKGGVVEVLPGEDQGLAVMTLEAEKAVDQRVVAF